MRLEVSQYQYNREEPLKWPDFKISSLDHLLFVLAASTIFASL